MKKIRLCFKSEYDANKPNAHVFERKSWTHIATQERLSCVDTWKYILKSANRYPFKYKTFKEYHMIFQCRLKFSEKELFEDIKINKDFRNDWKLAL